MARAKGTTLRSLLYLDTARLGPMVPAQRAQFDFVRLAAEEPSSLYFEEFLRHGFATWPAAYQERFPGLATWSGVAGLKNVLRAMLGAPSDWDVQLAGRSLPLLRHGAQALAGACRHVMTTDLSWPIYQIVVRREILRRDGRLTVVPLRRHVFRDGWSADDIATFLATESKSRGCDGLFLPAVDHLGICMPFGAIAERIARDGELRYALVDAAQGFCHVPLDDCAAHADFIVAGAHKWMGAYLPLAIAWIRRPVASGHQDAVPSRTAPADPLTQFTEQLAGDLKSVKTETVNPVPLLTAAAAAARAFDGMSPDEGRRGAFSFPRPSADWQSASISSTVTARIRLYKPPRRLAARKTAQQVREEWLAAGCIVTGYDGGVARIAIPRGHWGDADHRSPETDGATDSTGLAKGSTTESCVAAPSY